MPSQEFMKMLLDKSNIPESKKWFAKDSEVYHVCPKCTSGNDIEAENLRHGDPGNRRLCEKCEYRMKNNDCH